MGVKLTGIPARAVAPEDLRGLTVAVDAPNLLYAFYAVQLLGREATEERRASALRWAAQGLSTRLADLSRHGAKSVVVFDGRPHDLKMAHLEARERTRSVPPIQADEYQMARDVARGMGAPVVDAPHDAEAQASAMAARGLVDVVATTDWDALAMGAPLLLRNLSANPSKAEGRAWSLVTARDALAHLDADARTLALAVVLMGCDYFDGLDGYGPVKALKVARAARGDPDEALETAGCDADKRDTAKAALRMLLEPEWRDPGELRWTAVDTVRVRMALDGKPTRRVTQSRLE